jgi:hypothetical protein
VRGTSQRKDEITGKTVTGAVVSLDGFIAGDNDEVGPLFDRCGPSPAPRPEPGQRRHVHSARAEEDRDYYVQMVCP